MLKIWRPHFFQGSLSKSKYFEGWYFKNVDASEQDAFAVIPGISLSGGKSHSFIQVFDSRKQAAYYFRFGVRDFRTQSRPFSVSIGKSVFSLNRLQLDIEGQKHRVQADLEFSGIHSWPVRLLSPGAMGPFRFIPRMECYHGVLSFDHGISGFIRINGEESDLTGGRGYIEKDWGRSMPSSWIWMQTNHFAEKGVSLFGSIAKIPWLGNFFTGFIFGFYFRGRVYRFATYTGAQCEKLFVNAEIIEIVISDARFCLVIKADRQEGVDLPAPREGEMSSKVNESLKSIIKLTLIDKKKDRIIFAGLGRNAGLEFVGNTGELIAGLRAKKTN